jgi:hypothetical protein
VAKRNETAKVAATEAADDGTVTPPKVTGATSGVMATGPAGKAAREVARQSVQPALTGWRDPNAKFADDDNSIDARMWRTYTKGIRAK